MVVQSILSAILCVIAIWLRVPAAIVAVHAIGDLVLYRLVKGLLTRHPVLALLLVLVRLVALGVLLVSLSKRLRSAINA